MRPGQPTPVGELTRRELGSLSQQDGGIAAYAALVNWHRMHRFRANRGAASVIAGAGVTRTSTTCHPEHHPRGYPCAITLVIDRDRVLLGRQPS